MTRPRRPRIVWLTHLAAPYRVPVWRALAADWDIQVQTTEHDRRLGGAGAENRGADWRSSRFADLDVVALRMLRVRIRGHVVRFTLPTRGARPMRAAALAVVGGGWESPAYWWLILRAKLLRRPVVCFYESPGGTHRFRRGPVPHLRRFVLRRFDAVVVPGAAAHDAARAIGVDPRRIREGFNPVDVRAIARRAEEVRAAAGPRPAGHRFVYVGQLIDRKRVDVLLDAFAAAAGRDDRLLVLGSGEAEADLRRLAAAAGVADRVEFGGYVENDRMLERLAVQDTLCLVSREEVWGLVVNEALAAGLQVVVSENCGVAASVRGMAGVRIACADLADLSGLLRESAASWTGPIPQPAILRHGPEEFAAVLTDTFRSVLGAP